jgi:hypothetical protein
MGDQLEEKKETMMLTTPNQSLLTTKMARQTTSPSAPFHPYSHMRIRTTTCETSQNNSKCQKSQESMIHSLETQFEEPQPPCMPGYKDFYSLLLASCKTSNSIVEAEIGENVGLELDLSKCSSLLRRSVMMACRVELRETLPELGEIKNI